MQLFSKFILQCPPFRLMTDIINNATPASATTPFEWHSNLSATIEKVTNSALLTTTEGRAAIAAFVFPMATAICYAAKGILLCHRQRLMTSVLEDVLLLKRYHNHDKSRYFTLNYPLRGLQQHLKFLDAKCTPHILLHEAAEVAHWLTNALQYTPNFRV
eukprot:11298230-Ditylum_brightwellii.AAC.1